MTELALDADALDFGLHVPEPLVEAQGQLVSPTNVVGSHVSGQLF